MDAALSQPRSASRWWIAGAFILGCQMVGVLGALTTDTGTTSWYQELAKPSFQPPGWVFGPVWTLLYAMMGLAAWRIWERRNDHPGARRALGFFAAQLALNAIWTPVFFGAHEIGLALCILVALGLVLIATMRAFGRIDRPALWLLAPYLAWVCFATLLNAAIWRLN